MAGLHELLQVRPFYLAARRPARFNRVLKCQFPKVLLGMGFGSPGVALRLCARSALYYNADLAKGALRPLLDTPAVALIGSCLSAEASAKAEALSAPSNRIAD